MIIQKEGTTTLSALDVEGATYYLVGDENAVEPDYFTELEPARELYTLLVELQAGFRSLKEILKENK